MNTISFPQAFLFIHILRITSYNVCYTKLLRVDDFYICPHHPTEGQGEYQIDCDCRKGSPGMLLQAAADHGIDLAKSWMVGDKLADISYNFV